MQGYLHIRQRITRVLVALLAVFAVPLAIVGQTQAQSTSGAGNGRLITFHDRGETKVILTYAQTVRDAIKDAKILLAKEDIVEPGLDEPLVAADYTVNIYRARPVIIDDGLVRVKVMTAAQTALGIIEAAGLELHDEDKTSITASTDIIADGAGEVLHIDRAKEFTLDLYGTKAEAFSHADTVGEMLDEKGIVLGEKDRVAPERETLLEKGMTVSVWREGIQTRTVTESIDFPIRYIHDVDQPLGYSRIQTPGIKGQKNVTYQITIRSGREVKRKALQTVVLKQPKEQVVVVGAKGGLAAALAKLRQCESGGNYANKNNPRYRGAYQFSYDTWANNGGYKDPADAPPSLQDAAARDLYMRRGWQPWPACSKALGLQDIYR